MADGGDRVDIRLTARTSGWVEVSNAGGPNGCRVAAFLRANERGFDRVCFGDGPAPNVGVYAIKSHRVARFVDWAGSHGLVARQ